MTFSHSLVPHEQARLRGHSLAMGIAHNELQWANLCGCIFGSNTCIFFAKKWRILSKFSCFAIEGTHPRLKRMLRNTGGLSLLRGRLGLQVVADNHTIDDSLVAHGWDATKRAQHGQGPISVQRCSGPYKKTASNRHAAPSNPREAVVMPQEKDVRIEHEQGPLLPVGWGAWLDARVRSWGVLATMGVDPNEIHVNPYKIRTKFTPRLYEFLTNSSKIMLTPAIQFSLLFAFSLFNEA